MPFLSARWSHLCLLTYAVPPALLAPRVPPGLVLDARCGPGFEGKPCPGEAFVSLVAFDFLETRVLGIPWPGYRNFPEINLRFYVRDPASGVRGVVFIREFVPLRAVAFLARAIYGEPYRAARMESRITQDDRRITVAHRLSYPAGRENTLSVTAAIPASLPAADSVEHYFKEHQWGFGCSRAGQCTRYEVRHVHWDCYPVLEHQLDWDWSAVYGDEFGFLDGASPASVVLAVGSPITVHPQGRNARARC